LITDVLDATSHILQVFVHKVAIKVDSGFSFIVEIKAGHAATTAMILNLAIVVNPDTCVVTVVETVGPDGCVVEREAMGAGLLDSLGAKPAGKNALLPYNFERWVGCLL